MTGRVVALDQIGGRTAAALIHEGRLDDLLIDGPEDGAPSPGSIFRGIVDRPLKGQGGIFLRLPDGESAFLRNSKGLTPGQRLLVQVTGYSEAGKAVPVTDRLLFKSRYAIVTPDAPGLNISRVIKDEDKREELLGLAHDVIPEGNTFGLILRSSCAFGDEDEIATDIAEMMDLAAAVLADAEGDAELLLDGADPHMLAWREWSDPKPAEIATKAGSFADLGVLDAIDALSSPRVELANGAYMYVEPTRALVAVDVNTGGDTSPAAGLKANLAASRELPRQLRLRGLGGQVTVDFAPMTKNDRKQLEQSLRGTFRNDPIETALVGWTPIGHFELQRKRERLPLTDILPL